MYSRSGGPGEPQCQARLGIIVRARPRLGQEPALTHGTEPQTRPPGASSYLANEENAHSLGLPSWPGAQGLALPAGTRVTPDR